MLLVSALAMAACASAPVPCTVAEPAFAPPAGNAPDYDALDVYVRAAMRDWHVPGLALAIVAGDSVAFARGFGVRRVDAPGNVDVHTSFGLLSPTKTFTAAALAMLADEGVLSLDDPVVRYLPDFRVDDDRITAALRIRDLLSHATGCEENHRLWYKQGGTTRDVAARSGELRAIAPPRTAFHYKRTASSTASVRSGRSRTSS
jgi:CubicO group peptidase (beta-lactamase class C family)